MTRLFWKIFVWFLLAMTLIVATLVTLTVTMQSESMDRRFRQVEQTWIPLQAEHAAKLYEEEGSDALNAYLSRLEPMGNAKPSLYAENGKEVQGHLADEPDTDLQPLIGRAFQNGETQFSPNKYSRITAQRVIGPSGKSYVLVIARRPPPLMAILRADPKAQLVRLLAVLAVGAAVCFWLAHYITAPVRKLQQAAQQIAAGHLSTRIRPAFGSRNDEIANLGKDFDVMAERIETLMSSQRRLLQAISHELRSPLTRLSMALGLARQRPADEAAGALDRIEQEVNRLEFMISQLLTLTRLENGELSPLEPDVDLSKLLAEIVADADFEARGTGRSVAVLHTENCWVKGHAALLRSAIENVVRNAIRYTKEGTTVEVVLLLDERANDATAIIAVHDHGPGVPQADLENIFRAFFRVADARERETGGVGLGLAITDHAVRLHGGQVSARNSPQAGLIVELRIPAQRSPEHVQATAPVVESAGVLESSRP
jgi:two-component system sensor histidine kinase CpxA